MKLFGHKYKNIGHLERFFEETFRANSHSCAIAFIAYEWSLDKEATAVREYLCKKYKKLTLITLPIEAGCINDRLITKGVIISLLLSDKATIKAVSLNGFDATNCFGSKIAKDELKAALVFSSAQYIEQAELGSLFRTLGTKIVGIKSFKQNSKKSIWLNNEEIKNGVVVVGFAGKELRAQIYKNSEIKAISKKLEVTKAKNGFIYELEDLELLEAYKKLLGEDIVAQDPLLAACRFPLISQKSGKALFTEEFGADKAVMRGDVADGDLLQIGYASLKNISSKTYEIAKEASKEPPSTLLLFSDYTLRKFFKNKTQLAIPGSLGYLCESASFFGESEFFGESKDETIKEMSHSSVILALSEKDDTQRRPNVEEIKIPLTPSDAFVNLVDDALKEQFEINAKLKKALNTQKIFVSSISHDIRTPLNSIIGFLELLGCTDLDSEQQGYVHKSLTSSKHLLRLISDVLDVSKIEANQVEFFEAAFDYSALLDDIKNIVSSRCEKDVELVIEDPKLDRLVVGDADRVKQILINLLSNALKFTKEGFVRLETEIKHRHKHKIELEICVKDTGIGIEKSKLTEIFKPFYQTKESVSKNFSGTGLGLYICKNLCEMLGGNIKCESRLGNGAKFFVTMPLKLGKKIDKNQGRLELKYDFRTNDFKELKLLIVEDVAFNAELMTAMLDKKFGVKNIKFAKDGLEAIEMMRQESFELVFMDIQMPRLDGFSAIRLIREFDRVTPIVVMSANAFKEDIAKALKLGANDYITKPVRVEKVAEALGKFAPKSEKHSCELLLEHHDPTRLNMQRHMFAYYKSNLGLTGKDAKTLYNVCIDSIKNTIARVKTSLEAQDYKELYGAMHNLKGILASTGLDEGMHQATELTAKAKKASEGAINVIDIDFLESLEALTKSLSLLLEE
jgi:signal transduction histidine kinase/CheY-like chemotaxis protein/HPt (histidine-containing phosphotransfer) domain-containing protein